MMSAEETKNTTNPETEQKRTFEADVAKLLHLMVHSVYSDKDVFLRELISNAADACEKLRYEALSRPDLPASEQKAAIQVVLDPDQHRISIADNGIGMTSQEMIEALGTIARSGTRTFMENLATSQPAEGSQLIGQFGVGFYSTFMVAEKVEVFSRRAGSDTAHVWSSDGKGSYSVAPASLEDAPVHGTRVVLHLMDDAHSYAEAHHVERLIKEHSGHVPVPIALVEKPGAEPRGITDGTALWTRAKADIAPADYTDFYRSIASQFDDPALTVHVRAEGRQEYTMLAFVPGSRPFDLFDPQRKGRMKLYVRRVLITDDADLLPGYLRFIRGLIDSGDLPLNVSREMIQESPLLAAIRKAVTGRILSELEKFATSDSDAYASVWENFGAVLKEGLYEDFERRDALLGLARFKTTTSDKKWRSLKDYVASLRENQTAIYYLAGDDARRLETSPHLEGFRARGLEVLLLSDPVDSFWVTSALGFDGKPFKSVTQGAADLTAIPLVDQAGAPDAQTGPAIATFINFARSILAEEVAEVRSSDRLTTSAVCLVAPEHGMDKRLEQILASAGKLDSAAQKPVLEINPRHALIISLATAHESGREPAFVESATRLLLDEARILDGTVPGDPAAFAERLSQVLARSLAG